MVRFHIPASAATPPIRGLLVGILAAGLAACSSAPPPSEGTFDRRDQAAQFGLLGNKYFEEGRYDQALLFFRLALDYNTAVDNREGIIRNDNSIGKVYLFTDRPEEAETYFRRAYNAAVREGSRILLVESATNLGALQLHSGNHQEALLTFEDALRQARGGPEGRETAHLYHNYAAALKGLERYDEALAQVNRARIINTSNREYAELATNYYLIASIHSKRGDFDEALRFAGLALDNDKRVENSPGIAMDYLAIGIILDKAGKPEDAHDSYLRAFSVYRSINLVAGMLKVLDYLEDSASRLGLSESAALYANTRIRLSTLRGNDR